MKILSLKASLSILILALSTSLSYSAILQEPVEGSEPKYRTLYLFSEPVLAGKQAVQLPDDLKNLSQVQTPVVPSTTSETPFQMTARYQKATLENVEQIIQKYETIPGGVTLEGPGKGLPAIQTVHFDQKLNTFIVNDALLYKNPLTRYEMKEILMAIHTQDLMGVSLGDKDLVYGALQEGSLNTIYMKLLDHFLGCIAFGNNSWTAHHTFPGDYRPKPYEGPGNYYAVYFNFDDYQFAIHDSSIFCQGAHMTATLIPLTTEKDGKGSYIPDYTALANGTFPKEYEDNINHIADHIPTYQNDSRMLKVNAYGQAAAFARTLKQNNISLSKLAEQI